jgi:enediyne biosynthesis protein E4
MAIKKQTVILLLQSLVLLTSCHRRESFFESLPASATNIHFANNLDSSKNFRVMYFFYYYNGGGVATGDINNDGLTDIFFTANSKGNNRLYLNKGDFKFDDITVKAGVAGMSDWCTGVTMADVNGDGFLDIYVSSVNNVYNFKGHNELFINNNGDGTFTERAAEYGLDISAYTNQASFFDYDHDGDLDCYILNQSFKPNENLVDTGNRKKYDANSGDRLYRNDIDSTGKFSDVSAKAGIYQSSLGYGLGIAVADFNNDGWEDIYIGNDFHENDYYYLNNGDGTFTESGAAHFNHYSRFSMGNDVADYNNDGQLDIITADMLPPDEKILKTYGSGESLDIYNFMITKNGFQPQYSKNCLQRNNESGTSFSDVGLISDVSATDWSWCPLFADFDNDGVKDLFITSGITKRTVDLDYIRFISNLTIPSGADKREKYNEALTKIPDGASHNFIFQGNPNGIFTNKSKEWGTEKLKGYFNGAAYADFDNDGDIDIAINAVNAPAVIYKNNSIKKNYISLSFDGDGLNTKGIGVKAYLFTGNKLQYQQLMLTRGFQSSSEPRLHFGLDSSAILDSMLIVWPDQKFQLLKDVAANKQLIINKKEAYSFFKKDYYFKPSKELFEDISNRINLNWTHRENEFVDFNIQYLIPHAQSTRGPKIAVGDVNGDGLDDFYACGAKGQPGSLMIQRQDGTFMSSDTALFNRFAICEDVDAEFFDANGDGFLDLWVVSGGNEMPVNEIASADRLFINDGKGHFSFASGSIPHLFENKSCVATADIDKDGDNDVFVGFLSDPLKFGIPQNSYLYLNDGKANFSIASKETINLLKIGMVTSASFADVNNDQWPDLIAAGEWMPVKVYINNKGKFSAGDILQSTGLWQTIYATDVNGDGFMDILAGNWGHNSKLYAGKSPPLKLYVNDFDHNGSIEQIMCYTVGGSEYTFLAKDELERSLPVLKKAYLNYKDVAGKTVQYMFYDLFKNYTELKAEVLGSSCFINDGKGNFVRKDLPEELQLAPVMAFAPSLQKGSFIGGGNFYGVIPYEGRYDALLPSQFSVDGNSYNHLLPGIEGEIRDIKWINTGNGKKILALARNNNSIYFLKPNN